MLDPMVSKNSVIRLSPECMSLGCGRWLEQRYGEHKNSEHTGNLLTPGGFEPHAAPSWPDIYTFLSKVQKCLPEKKVIFAKSRSAKCYLVWFGVM